MNKTIAVVVGIVIVIVGFAFFARPVAKTIFGGAVLPNYSTTNSSSTCDTVIRSVLTANSAIQARFLTNVGTSTATLWFNATSTGMSVLSGITLYPSSTLNMSDAQGNLWTGNIYCLTAAGSSTISYTQW